MIEVEEKFKVLSKIGKQLNDNNITLAIGASVLLYIISLMVLYYS